jgi:hypothetical protein
MSRYAHRFQIGAEADLVPAFMAAPTGEPTLLWRRPYGPSVHLTGGSLKAGGKRWAAGHVSLINREITETNLLQSLDLMFGA